VEVVHLTSSREDCKNDACLVYFYNQEIPMHLETGCDNVDSTGECVCLVVSYMRYVTDEEVDRMRRDFTEEGIVSIPNIILEQVMDAFVEDLKQLKHSHFWHASFWDDRTSSARLIARTEENEPWIARILQKQHEMRARRDYAYSFTRTSDRVPWIVARLHSLFYEHTLNMLQSNQMRNLLYDITGKDYELAVAFFSRYSAGDL
jgi:hypothetical protein